MRGIRFKHFLEVFNPNVGMDKATAVEIGEFVNDNIVRVRGGARRPAARVPEDRLQRAEGARGAGQLRPDPDRRHSRRRGGDDATRSELPEGLAEGRARVALFGRKINLAEHPWRWWP
ncbi:MAG: hypothetical protein R3C69_09805 [Geminicoccaceae bacterium]